MKNKSKHVSDTHDCQPIHLSSVLSKIWKRPTDILCYSVAGSLGLVYQLIYQFFGERKNTPKNQWAEQQSHRFTVRWFLPRIAYTVT